MSNSKINYENIGFIQSMIICLYDLMMEKQ